MINVTVEEMLNAPGRKKIIDIRPVHEFNKDHIPESENIEAGLLREDASFLPKDLPIYIICHTGEMSAEIGEELS